MKKLKNGNYLALLELRLQCCGAILFMFLNGGILLRHRSIRLTRFRKPRKAQASSVLLTGNVTASTSSTSTMTAPR